MSHFASIRSFRRTIDVSDDGLLPPEGFRQRGPAVSGTRLLLIRHGESYANARGVAGGPRGDGGLTDLGRRQANALAERLAMSGELDEATALYTSTLPRAQQTSEILRSSLPSHLSLVVEHDLCELSVGEGDGLTWAEFAARFPAVNWDDNPTQRCAPGGESLIEFYERCRVIIAELCDRHPNSLIVAVAHGGVIEQALKMAQGLSAATRLGPRIEHCSMTEIEFRSKKHRVLRYNDLSPLPKRG